MHALTWGANYRYSMDRVDNTSAIFAFLPADVDQQWASLFAQDEMTLRENLRLTTGVRIERNDYTGNEVLPNARLAWKITPNHLLWTAISRAVRAPSRLDRDAYIPATPPFLLDGGREARSEIAKVFEIGYRGQPAPGISWSVTAFHSAYDHLRTQEIAPSGTFVVFANGMEGTVSGIETWGTYQASPNWRLSGGFTALKEKLSLKPDSNDTAAPTAAGNDPAQSWQLRSTLNIAPNRTLDVSVRHAAALAKNDVPSYTAIDARYGWKVRPGLELSVAGQNLTGSHAEYGPAATRSEIPRGIYVKLLWQN
jgi:iron complex outermembrane receptor protein